MTMWAFEAEGKHQLTNGILTGLMASLERKQQESIFIVFGKKKRNNDRPKSSSCTALRLQSLPMHFHQGK